MTPAISSALTNAAELAQWMEENKPKQLENANDRLVLASAFFLVTHEHQLAVLTLFQKRLPSSAFALVRCLLDSYIRGEWAAKVATDEEIEAFQNDRFEPAPDNIIKKLRKHAPDIGNPLEEFKRLGWKRLSGFTHGGFSQMSNWISDGAIGPIHSDESTVRAIALTSRFAFLASLSLVEILQADPEPFFVKGYELGFTSEPAA